MNAAKLGKKAGHGFSTMLTTLLVATVLAPQIARARLGETKADCDKRYGTVTAVYRDNGQVNYEKNGLEILCYFSDRNIANGTVRMIVFQDQNGGLLSFEKAAELVGLNAQKSKWSKPYKSKGVIETDVSGAHIQWSREDGGSAKFVKGDGYISLTIDDGSISEETAAQHRALYKKVQGATGDTSTF